MFVFSGIFRRPTTRGLDQKSDAGYQLLETAIWTVCGLQYINSNYFTAVVEYCKARTEISPVGVPTFTVVTWVVVAAGRFLVSERQDRRVFSLIQQDVLEREMCAGLWSIHL